jgi:hypothetical protein
MVLLSCLCNKLRSHRHLHFICKHCLHTDQGRHNPRQRGPSPPFSIPQMCPRKKRFPARCQKLRLRNRLQWRHRFHHQGIRGTQVCTGMGSETPRTPLLPHGPRGHSGTFVWGDAGLRAEGLWQGQAVGVPAAGAQEISGTGGLVAPQLLPATVNRPSSPVSQICLQRIPFLAAGVSGCPTTGTVVSHNLSQKAREAETPHNSH